ncbi:MAG TPA: hypothetical protein VN408_03765 [Actinoplanes sp.]|nr:hypothetical protein [Actinoplanes sp.]
MKPSITAVALGAAAVLLSSCAAPAAVPEPVAITPAAVAAGTGFFDPLRPGPAMDLKAPPATLKDAYTQTTVVVEADVTGVRVGREIGDMSSVIVTLAPVRVLRGALRPALPVEVEFGPVFEPDDVARVATTMDAARPGRGVWLLRWQGEPAPHRKPGVTATDPTADLRLYRTVHLQCGVFVQGPEHVEAPSARDDGERAGPRIEAERFATLAELADHAVMA